MIKEWRPVPRQAEFISLPDTIFEALYGGAAGGGKTDCLLMLPLAKQFHLHPRFKGIIFRRTYPELESEIIVRSKEWYPHAGAQYSVDKKRWTFPSGAIMQFGHVEYESDVRKYDSAEYNYMAFDELTSFTEYQYSYLSITRCRSSSKNLPSIVRAGTNPGNVGHTWVKKRFIDPAPMRTIIVDKRTNQKRIFIQSLVTDNTHIEKDYASRLALLNDADRRAKLDGDWESFEGQVFDDFRPKNLPGEPENAVHVVSPFTIPNWWIKVMAIDWGYAAKTVILWGALSPDDRLYIYREQVFSQTRISEWSSSVGKASEGEQFIEVSLCQSAWQNRGDDLAIWQQFQKYSNITPTKARNDRLAGKIMIQEYLRFNQKPSSQITGEYDSEVGARILRNGGMQRFEAYIKSFEPTEPEQNLPKLQIFDTCTELISTIPRCIYAPKDKTTGKPSEDVMEFTGDDAYDTLKYLVLAADEHTSKLTVTAAHRKKIDEIVKGLQATQDQTAFYRKMEFIERSKVPQIRPVTKGSYYRRIGR